MTPMDGLFILVIVWGSLFMFLWIRGLIFDRKNKK